MIDVSNVNCTSCPRVSIPRDIGPIQTRRPPTPFAQRLKLLMKLFLQVPAVQLVLLQSPNLFFKLLELLNNLLFKLLELLADDGLIALALGIRNRGRWGFRLPPGGV